MASIKRRPGGKFRARYRDAAGKEHAQHFTLKKDAQAWLDEQTAALVAGTHVAPRDARIVVSAWCDTWLQGYGVNRPQTVRQAGVHVKRIKAAFGEQQLGSVRPSQVRSWTAALKASGLSESYVYALHARLSQIMSDAVHDGLLARNPCSRRTSPPAGKQRPYVATTDQVWELYDAMPKHVRAAVLLGAFAGLRTAEACGLHTRHVDFLRGIVHPTLQYPAVDLKTEASRTAVPVPAELTLQLSAHLAAQPRPGEWLLLNEYDRQLSPWQLERAVRDARANVPGLPDGFRFHDLRHYFASLLIASGSDVKVVQARLRHASAKTTLDTYGHLWPDADESTRAAVGVVLAARADSLRTSAGSAG